ncbi:MAG TPA: autotransporter-associated beta strand repeat-containing protein, partial [Kiritimatiellia bacterium]|nr:autotransporter-associated beta strand repeat-containing protein [Kiritimatiellia bacterium]
MKTKFFCMLSLLAACCWTAHGAVIDLNGVDLTVTEPNADGYVNTSQTAATLTLDLAGPVAYAGTISGNLSLIKAGAGTLTLSNACPYTGTTHVNGGVLEAPTDAYFGSGDGEAAVTLSNDARVRLTTTCTLLKRPFGVAEGATGHLEMPTNVVVTTPASNLFFKGAVLTKSGSGTLAIYAADDIKFNANGSAAVAGGTLRVVEGSLAVTSPDVFGNASGPANMTLELCSGITFDLDRQRTPLPQRSLLRGATITTKQRTPENKRFEQFAYMKDYDLNSVFTVYPGEGNAVTSVISAVDGCHLAQQPGGDTIFDVQEGAVLRIEARLYNAHTKTGTLQGFVKRGTGALVLAQPCSA